VIYFHSEGFLLCHYLKQGLLFSDSVNVVGVYMKSQPCIFVSPYTFVVTWFICFTSLLEYTLLLAMVVHYFGFILFQLSF